MFTKLKNRTKGFTIIEVLIVLAIGGLILLIVFLAVPALQRTSRNTQRTNDAAGIASAAANVVSNTNGQLPKEVNSGDSITASTGSISLRVSSTVTTVETANLGFYQAGTALAWGTSTGKVYIGDYTGPATLAPAVVAVGSESATNISTESVIMAVGYKCNASNSGLGTKSSRSIAILYVREAAGGNGNLACTAT